MKHIYVYASLMIVVSLMVPGAYASPGSSSHASSFGNSKLPGVSFHTFIAVNNNMGISTPANYNEMIVVNSSLYSHYENSNLSNVWFSYANGTVINSWLQSGGSSSYNNTTYWLKLDSPIGGFSSATVEMNFLPLGEIAFNGITTGEAPQLTKVYGQYDNGAHVFEFYDNFAGTVLNTSKWITTGAGSGSGKAIVNNSLHLTYSHDIFTRKNFTFPSMVESCGMIGKGNYDSIGYFLNGVGFSTGGYYCSLSDIASGWASNSSNGPGMSQWTSTGITYTFNYSKSVNSNKFHTYGIDMVSEGYLDGIINGQVGNTSHVSFPAGPKTLNATIGFQCCNYSPNNTFYWVFVKNSTSNGMLNLPYTTGYKVSLEPVGLPAGVAWNGSINGIPVNGTGGESTSVFLINGTYTANFSGSNGYEAYPATFHFNIQGIAQSPFKIFFENPVNQTYLRAASTFSSRTMKQIPGFESNVSPTSGVSTISSTAMDQSTGTIFAALIYQNKILKYNPLTGNSSVFNTKVIEPTGMYYDGQNNLLYVDSAANGNLSIISASTGIIEKNVSLHQTICNLSYILPGHNSSMLYVMTAQASGISNFTSNVYVVDVNGTVLKDVPYSNMSSFPLLLSPPQAFNGDLLVINGTGVLSLSPLNGTEKFVAFPKGFIGADILNYANSSLFLVGTLNTSSTGSLIFNATSGTFAAGIPLNGVPLTESYNTLAGIAYVQSYNIVQGVASISAVKYSNGKILATAPYYNSLSEKMFFDTSNRNLYITNNFIINPEEAQYIHIYNTSSRYTVTFRASGLQSGGSWILDLNGTNHTVAGSQYTVSGINGTSYSFSVYNNTQYYISGATSGTVTIRGSDETVNFSYHHYAYIVGTFTQKGLNVTVNGVLHSVGNSKFNISVVAGTYHVVISDQGYVSRYVNFTLASGGTENISTALNHKAAPASSSATYYYAAAIVAVVSVIAAAVVYVRRK